MSIQRLYRVLNNNHNMEFNMQICPISYATGCAKCPIFKVCPAKNIIGDAKKDDKKSNKKE